MSEPKALIYSYLITINIPNTSTPIPVYQERPEVLTSFPVITFYISNNKPDVLMDKTLGADHMEVTIDIWSKNSKEAGLIMKAVESVMRSNNFLISYNSDIVEPENIAHIQTRFIY